MQKLTLSQQWPLVLVAAIALPLLLAHLGSDYLWLDEADTAVLSSNILRYGVPKAWDGVTFIDSDRGARLNDELVMVSHPWLQYYLTAGSFAVFGQNNWAARLPFALAGWLTILIVYTLVYDISKERWAAFCAAVLLATSVQFLLFCRQCRYYSLNMMLGCLVVWLFLRMKSARVCALFAFASILLFHAHPFGIVVVGTLAVVSLIYQPFREQRRWLRMSMPVIALFTVPWIPLAYHGYGENSDAVRGIAQFCGRLIQYLIECASVTPLIGVFIIAFICGFFALRQRQKSADKDRGDACVFFRAEELGLLFIGFSTLLFQALSIAASESADDLWHIGVRYTSVIIPLMAIVASLLILKVSRGRVWIWLPLLLLFCFTKLAQLTPWIFWGRAVTTFDGREVVEAHLPRDTADRYLNTNQQWSFLRDLTRDNVGTVGNICKFLEKNARPGDVIITNYDWEPLYFYTRLPQALKILPDYPIYNSARREGLPDYVFSVDHARWIIWRPIWEGYVGYFDEHLRRATLSAGARVSRVAQFDETIWENRPEIHLHRFSGDKYFFTAPENKQPAEIFRLEWPTPE